MQMNLKFNGPFYYASNAHEAIRVANKLKQQGDYDLFRGQIRNFPIQPSIFRPGINRETSIDRLNRFTGWVESVFELNSLHNNLDAILAVAQHYGLKTTFLDFTTNPLVAGFFATDGDLPPVANDEYESSCIICVNREVFVNSWQDINERSKSKGRGDLVRIVELDVRNLWRLQAQEGLFIDVRVEPTLLEMFSFFFRIMFPYKGRIRSVKRENIYPDRKSHLEVLFEEYVSHENRLEGVKRLERMGFVRINSSQEPFSGEPGAFKSGKLPAVLPSWNKEKLADWRKEPDERHQDVQSKNTVRISLREGETVSDLSSRISQQVLRAIQRNAYLRHVSVKWVIRNPDGTPLTVDDESQELLADDTYPQIGCQFLVSLLWDGVRRLPYTNEQIAISVANYICFAKHGERAADQLFGKTIGVEFSGGAAMNRAIVSEDGMMNCIRSGFLNLVSHKEAERIVRSVSPASEVLGILVDPSRLFEFSLFADLFVRQVIPTQLWIRSEENMIIFSPARLDVFGNS